MFDWTNQEEIRNGVRCRLFRPKFDGRMVTAAFFDLPESPADCTAPLVLMQHGGSSSKTGLTFGTPHRNW